MEADRYFFMKSDLKETQISMCKAWMGTQIRR